MTHQRFVQLIGSETNRGVRGEHLPASGVALCGIHAAEKVVTGGNSRHSRLGAYSLTGPKRVNHRLQVRLHHEIGGQRCNVTVLACICSLLQSIVRLVFVFCVQRPEKSLLEAPGQNKRV